MSEAMLPADVPWQPFGGSPETRPTVTSVTRSHTAPHNLHVWQLGAVVGAGSLRPANPLADWMHVHPPIRKLVRSTEWRSFVQYRVPEPATDANLLLLAEGFPTPSEETMWDADLQAAWADLNSVVQEAHDEGFPTPSEETIGVAERLLRAMYELRRCRLEVYPTQDGEVAVAAPGGHGRSVLVVCDSEGGVLCSVNLNGQHRRAVYDSESATALPDGFVQEALAALDA